MKEKPKRINIKISKKKKLYKCRKRQNKNLSWQKLGKKQKIKIYDKNKEYFPLLREEK